MSLGLEVLLETKGGNKPLGYSKTARDRGSLRDIFSAAIAMALGQGTHARNMDMASRHADGDGWVGLVREEARTQAEELLHALAVGSGPGRASASVADGAFASYVNTPLTEGEEVLSMGQTRLFVPGSVDLSMPAGAPRGMLAETGLDAVGTSLPFRSAALGRSDLAPEGAIHETASVAGSLTAATGDAALAESLPEVLGDSGAMEPGLKAAGRDVDPKPTGAAAPAPSLRAVLRQAEGMARGGDDTASLLGVSASEPQGPSAEGRSETAKILSRGKQEAVRGEDTTLAGARESNATEATDGVTEDALTHGFESHAFQVSGQSPRGSDEVDRPTMSLGDVKAVADRIREEALKRLPRSVEIRLDPPELGKVTVLLSTRGQDVAVRFVAAASETQEALTQASGDLAQALSERGLTLAGFSVDQGAHDNASQTQPHEVWASARSRTPRHSVVGVLPAGAANAAPRHALGVCDYFV